MAFNSIPFLFFFPIIVLFYFLLPYKIRWIWLLIASYSFYMAWNVIYALPLTVTIVVTWLSGHLIQWSNKQEDPNRRNIQRKLWVGLSFGLNLSVLFLFKYFHFMVNHINRILVVIGAQALQPSFDMVLPVGISFYIFRALSYTMDVYYARIHAEKNFFKYALFVSFFPQLMAGPIERAKNLLPQFSEQHTFNVENAKNGLLLMLWGFFKKLVIADRLVIMVNQVFDNYTNYAGLQIALAVFFLAVQIYCDFSAYTDIAKGAVQVLGFRQTDNFRQPYFATSIQDFWKRWHITLGNWFRDYVFLPLSGFLMKRKWGLRLVYLVSSLVVWLLTGLWHGASLSFVAWGLLHGIYLTVGFLTASARSKLYARLRFRTEGVFFRLGQGLTTFALTCFAWVFFRARSFMEALQILKRMVTAFHPSILFRGAFDSFGLNQRQFMIALFSIAVLLCYDIFDQKANVYERLSSQKAVIRWAVYFIAVFAILIFGIYGDNYPQTQFVYFQF